MRGKMYPKPTHPNPQSYEVSFCVCAHMWIHTCAYFIDPEGKRVPRLRYHILLNLPMHLVTLGACSGMQPAKAHNTYLCMRCLCSIHTIQPTKILHHQNIILKWWIWILRETFMSYRINGYFVQMVITCQLVVMLWFAWLRGNLLSDWTDQSTAKSHGHLITWRMFHM